MADRDDDRHVPADDFDDPDAPASAEEVAASKRLRDALENAADAAGGPATPEAELALSLRAAWSPAALESGESRAVLDATPSAEEQELATALRGALEELGERAPRASDRPETHLVHALRCAFSPADIDPAEHRALVDAALVKMVAAKKGRVVRVAFGVVAGGLALAASIVFVVTTAPTHSREAPLAMARTTQPLFSEPFKPGETSARIDRIASARASDFRDNRFTKWGVR